MASIWAKPDATEPAPIDPAALAAMAGQNAPPVFRAAAPEVEPALDPRVAAGLAGTQAKLPPIFAPTTPTVRMPTGLERAQGAQDARLSKLVMQDQNPWGTPQNHPGILGKIGHALNYATGGDTRRGWAENALIKELDTEAAAQQLRDLQGSETERNKAETGVAGAQQKHTEEETREMPETLESEIGLRGAEQWKAQHPWADLPGNEPLTNTENIQKGLNDLYLSANPGAKAVPPEFTLPANPTKDDLARVQANLTHLDTQNMTNAQRADANAMRMLMYGLAQQRAAEEKANAGNKNLWSVPQPDGSKKIVQLNPGDTIPAGAVLLSGQSTENSKAGAADAPTVDALNFANDYMKSGKFTGPSDEALQDQFFQMAKPSSGFRMNQAQIDQLHNMASWMDSWEGKAYHAVNGVWFAPKQRENIVATMNALAKSKGITPGGTTPAAAPNVGGGAGAPAAPKIGDTKKFPNGKMGKWDGTGWVAQ